MISKLAAYAGKNLEQFRTTIARGNYSGGRGPSDLLVVLSGSRQHKGQRGRVRVSFHPRAIQQLGWMKGDRVSWVVTESGGLLFYRHPEGMALTLTSYKKGVDPGKCRLQAQYIIDSVELYEAWKTSTARNVEIENGRIAFDVE